LQRKKKCGSRHLLRRELQPGDLKLASIALGCKLLKRQFAVYTGISELEKLSEQLRDVDPGEELFFGEMGRYYDAPFCVLGRSLSHW